MVLKRVLNWIINFTIIFLIVTFSPGLGPKTTFPFEEFTVSRPRLYEPNDYLEKPEILLKGKVHGPEHILEKDGVFYASLHDGNVVKIVGDKIEMLSPFGKYCTSNEKIPLCGRPLGLAFDKSKKDTIIVVDSSTGIFELNYVTKAIKLITLTNEVVGRENPRESNFLNSVDVASNGDLYYTDSSSDFGINQAFLNAFLNPSGRLIHYNRKAKKARILLDRLYLANGVALSPNEDFVVVAEFGRNRLIKYYLTGDRADTYHVFADSLPGCPDNITPDENGLWVALPMTSDHSNMVFFQKLSEYPTIRKFFARILYLSSTLFKKAYVSTEVEMFKSIAMNIDSMNTFTFLNPKRSTILRLNWNGKIIAMYHSYDGSAYSHVLDNKDGKLYLGSYSHDYIARVSRQKHD